VRILSLFSSKDAFVMAYYLLAVRISPHHSPEPSPKAEDAQLLKSSHETTSAPVPAPVEVEMDLEIPSSPPPIESTLAARRAKRQAILAKYAGTASVDTNVSPSPGPNSAVPRAHTPSATSNPISKTNSRNESPVPQNGQPGQYAIFLMFSFTDVS
jgi:serine/threonine-protein kinase PRP4